MHTRPSHLDPHLSALLVPPLTPTSAEARCTLGWALGRRGDTGHTTPAVKGCSLIIHKNSTDLSILKPKASAPNERKRPRARGGPSAGGGLGHQAGSVREGGPRRGCGCGPPERPCRSETDHELAGRTSAAGTLVPMHPWGCPGTSLGLSPVN